MADNIKVLNEFLPKAEPERLGAIKIGDTLSLDADEVLNVDSASMTGAYMTNCITEIPQDVSASLDTTQDILTIKASSKLYFPDGFEADGVTPKFTIRILEEDVHCTQIAGTDSSYNAVEKLLLYLDENDVWTERSEEDSHYFTGDTAPTVTDTNTIWYDTANNIIKMSFDTGTTWSAYHGVSLPILQMDIKNSKMQSILYVYNGFTYAGSTVFALPGVKGLIPNGRNEDGSLKNINFAIDHVLSHTFSQNYTGPMVWGINANTTVFDVIYFTEQDTKPTDNNWAWLNPETNILSVNPWNGSEYVDYPAVQGCLVAKMHRTAEHIDFAEFQKPIRLANIYDVNEKLTILQDTKLDTSRIQYVSAVPGNPQDGVIYLIAQ